MAFGSLIGAGCFVNMVVIGMILKHMVMDELPARGAFLRDAAAYLLALLSLIAFQISGNGSGFTSYTCVGYLLGYLVLCCTTLAWLPCVVL